MNRAWERLLSAYVDGEVTPEERRQVEEWLRQDPEAQAEYRELVRLRDLLRSLPPRPAPPDLEGRILRAALGRATGPKPARMRQAVWVGAVVAAAAVGLFPLVRGGLDRLRASEPGVHGYTWQHVAHTATDPLVDRAYLGVALTDATLELLGERPAEEQR
ncbi:MAG: zf-HC2 domain-containing protein [Armatimonadota bacterium]|nr:zf-HC2 domain-containing protein [Armatimonadota bacterium]MDR5676122.1 zf-HC2 domain-containing protein [Armatimonadota bacterium]MDR7390369.1 zf-HC2 domain-containing protein [Armatimonadota bacterium]MDR7407335.1 zf-HC2 domain-containing protein [Armatimonadota bacterium]MDR7425934.1 zf-HC2 domain-containing protein [Armatimonadota bacterium]